MTTWHDIESARDEWVDAPLDDDVLGELLDIAEQQVVAYAPALPEPTDEELEDSGWTQPIPAAWRRAQLTQARNIWNAAKVDPSGGVGDDTFVLRPHPLDWHVKQLLRPRKGVPRVR
jgi:hypothetical protein